MNSHRFRRPEVPYRSGQSTHRESSEPEPVPKGLFACEIQQGQVLSLRQSETPQLYAKD